jgi:hypothetical protein
MLSFFHRTTTFNDDQVVHHSWENVELYEKDMVFKMAEKLKNLITYISNEAKKSNATVLFSGVPFFINNMDKKSLAKIGLSDDNFVFYKRLIYKNLEHFKKQNDLARDGYHFGEKTSYEIANNFYEINKKCQQKNP